MRAATPDSVRHTGFTVYTGPAWQIAMDEYERRWLKGKSQWHIGAELNYTALPCDSDAFAKDYNYPTLSLGMNYSFNHGVTMRRTADPSWGKAQMVDYDSRLGNILTLYGSFERPLLRRGRWQIDYVLRMGFGYNTWQYNPTDNIDNELIGSKLSIYFGAGLQASYQLSNDWALTGGILYGHHSNGALDRPNKGENHWGPFLGVRYKPTAHKAPHTAPKAPHTAPEGATLPWTLVSPSGDDRGAFSSEAEGGALGAKGAYATIRLGIGAKTLLEDWQETQFQTEPGAAGYRTDQFRLYAAYSLQCDVMYRYARRWASGIGMDVFYGTYDDRVREIEQKNGGTQKVSPWSVGIAARHEVYYHNLSLDMTLGVYLYRHMGTHAKEIETPYYERIGLFYTFPQLGGLRLGASVKAHRTKADLTEVIISYPIRLSRKSY